MGLCGEFVFVEQASEEVASQGVTTAFLPVGDTRLELLEPTGQETPVGRFLERRGPGLHHVCFGVEDVQAAAAELSGAPSSEVRVGSGRGKPSAFLPGDQAHGTLVEVTAST